ncbi:MAG: biotin/lipoyl-binding protein [Pseudomonadota bacterium]|nr:biotin/lipoyl-binding protein [Pseudomonadota bacterium]
MTDQTNAVAQTPHKPSILREISIILISILIGAGLLFGAYLYWEYEGEHPSTDDAYLQANFVWISPRIDGQITEVQVKENQFVEAGAELFRIDPRPFRATLEKASSAAELVAQTNKIDAAAVAAAEAKVNEQQANLDDARE